MTSNATRSSYEPKVITITHHPRVPLCKIIKIYEKVDQISTVAIERDPRNLNRQRITITFEGNKFRDDMHWNFDNYEPERNSNITTVGDLKQRMVRPITTLKCIFPDMYLGKDRVRNLLNHFDEFGELLNHRIIYDDYGEPIVAYVQYKNGEQARRARFWSDPIYRTTYILDDEFPFESNISNVQEPSLITESKHPENVENTLATADLAERAKIVPIYPSE